MFKTIACSSIIDPWASVSYLDSKREPQNKWMCMKAHGKVFGVWSREKRSNKEILSGTPSSKCFTHGVIGIWGELER
jgi:hypothetical protein